MAAGIAALAVAAGSAEVEEGAEVAGSAEVGEGAVVAAGIPARAG